MNSVPYMRKVCINTEKMFGPVYAPIYIALFAQFVKQPQDFLKNVTIFFFSWSKY